MHYYHTNFNIVINSSPICLYAAVLRAALLGIVTFPYNGTFKPSSPPCGWSTSHTCVYIILIPIIPLYIQVKREPRILKAWVSQVQSHASVHDVRPQIRAAFSTVWLSLVSLHQPHKCYKSSETSHGTAIGLCHHWTNASQITILQSINGAGGAGVCYTCFNSVCMDNGTYKIWLYYRLKL